MSDFPACRYGPDGATAIFEREEDVPAGWFDHPSKVIEPKGGDLPASAEFAKFDADGDGQPGGSLPKAKRRKKPAAKKAVSRDPRK